MSHPRLLFAATVFLAAFLLFLVEPIAAKQLLPILGGSASVWITCLVFFQTALLIGYLYAHWHAGRAHTSDYIAVLGLAVLAAITWAAYPGRFSNGATHPIATVFTALTIWIGAPFI